MGSKESSILTLAMIPCSHWESWFSNFSILYSHIESFPTSGSQGVPHFRRDMRGCNTQPYLIISSRALSSLFVPLLVNPKPSTSTAHSCCPWWNKAQHHGHVSRLSSHKSFKQTHTLSRRPRGYHVIFKATHSSTTPPPPPSVISYCLVELLHLCLLAVSYQHPDPLCDLSVSQLCEFNASLVLTWRSLAPLPVPNRLSKWAHISVYGHSGQKDLKIRLERN